MRKKEILGFVLSIFCVLCMACGQKQDSYLESYEEQAAMTENTMQMERSEIVETETQLQTMCYVYICGAVEHPGVYILPEGSRIFEVIQMAGGLQESAAEALVNQAEQISDGMMIQIYTQEEAAQLGKNGMNDVAGDAYEDDGKVNINTAGVTELMTVPGIGNTRAEAIVAYRMEHGAFSCIEDLMNVSGIKEGTFLKMKEHIKVND